MRVEAVFDEISVVGLVVHIDGEIAIGKQQVLNVEITYKTGRSVFVVAIAKLAVDKKPVVQKPSAEQSFVFGIVPSFVAGRDVSPEIPITGIDEIAKRELIC